jgi:hypothetical protein
MTCLATVRVARLQVSWPSFCRLLPLTASTPAAAKTKGVYDLYGEDVLKTGTDGEHFPDFYVSNEQDTRRKGVIDEGYQSTSGWRSSAVCLHRGCLTSSGHLEIACFCR